MIIWDLFDSGEGSYSKALEEYNQENGTDHQLIPIGLDIKKRRTDFVQLDLATNTLLHKKSLMGNPGYITKTRRNTSKSPLRKLEYRKCDG